MASRSTPRSKLASPLISSKSLDSPSSSSRFVPEASVDDSSSPASTSALSKSQFFFEDSTKFDADVSKENVTVTVRFRHLSQREISKGEGTAWCADGDTIVRSEHNASLAYAYDRVFGPTTTTHHVYDVAARHVVNGAMKGINGTIFAYGVTSSGKTHTMHGDQRSPGIIPLAVKDAFSIIQETPRREFLLRVSYLEIYNEVVNDLLNPAGQNLKIREDVQGTFVEGVKEEVVLSPTHALSLIASGEEHRHIGSNNVNLASSRSHTIFTLTIESTPCGECAEGQAVNLSQLNLIDLAGSESSRAETSGVRQKEGAYINKSLLTLGTVMAKLTDGKSIHIPYRDSKLTRLLQSSLSGKGRVSLICTVTPASSNLEETHNTLKFAHRAKQIKIEASQNKIINEKSLIKKYQYEIRSLKEELEQLKKGIVPVSPVKDMGEVDIDLLKQKLVDGQVKLQSRLEQEEDAKAALLGRIQRLTKLILVSTKATQSPRYTRSPGSRRRHSLGEDELSFLCKRRDMVSDNERSDHFGPLEEYDETMEAGSKHEKDNRKHGLLNLFKAGKRENGMTIRTSFDGDKSSGAKPSTAPSTPQAQSVNFLVESSISNTLKSENLAVHSSWDTKYDRMVPEGSFALRETPVTSMNAIDHVDLLREQLKILSGELALHSSILKRLSDEATNSPKKEQIQLEITKAKDEIMIKNQQIAALEKQMADSISEIEKNMLSPQSYAEVLEQLNEKSFELEVKIADNRIIQEQLQHKICECEELQEAVTSLKQQLLQALDTKTSFSASMRLLSVDGNKKNAPRDATTDLREQAHMASEIEELKQKIAQLRESNNQLENQNQKLAEESTYAKGLASAAGVELKALSDEVTKLMKNNEKLVSEISSLKNSPRRASNGLKVTSRVGPIKPAATKREVNTNNEREMLLEAALKEKEQREAELEKQVKESKQKEAALENELGKMWVVIAKLNKSQGNELENSDSK